MTTTTITMMMIMMAMLPMVAAGPCCALYSAVVTIGGVTVLTMRVKEEPPEAGTSRTSSGESPVLEALPVVPLVHPEAGRRRSSVIDGRPRSRTHSITFPVGFASLVANPIGSIEETGATGSLLQRFVHEEVGSIGRVRRFSIVPPTIGSLFAPNRMSTIEDGPDTDGIDEGE